MAVAEDLILTVVRIKSVGQSEDDQAVFLISLWPKSSRFNLRT